MKIFLLGQKNIGGNSVGGVERHVEFLAKNLVKDGNEVFVYCREKYLPEKPQKYEGVNLLYIPTLYSKHLEAIIHTFLSTLDVVFRRKEVDVIHYHAIGPSSMILIAKFFRFILNKKFKIIATYHCQDYKHQKWGILARAYLKFGEWVACTFADEVIAVSKGLVNFAKEKYNCDAVYIPNGVEEFPKVDNFQEILDLWQLKKEDYFLSVSRLVKHKGIHYLIEAYKKLNLSQKLVIVGASSYTDLYESDLKQLASGNSNIIFTGELSGDKLASLFQNTLCFVQPSEAEGLSVALLEAVSSGRGCIVSNIPENLEVVGEKSLIFENKNIFSLKDKLDFVSKNKSDILSLGLEAKKRLGINYNWSNITKKTLEIYN